MGLYGRPRPVPFADMEGERDHTPAPGDHKGLVKIPRIFLVLPHIIRPRPYGSSGLLSISRLSLMPIGGDSGTGTIGDSVPWRV